MEEREENVSSPFGSSEDRLRGEEELQDPMAAANDSVATAQSNATAESGEEMQGEGSFPPQEGAKMTVVDSTPEAPPPLAEEANEWGPEKAPVEAAEKKTPLLMGEAAPPPPTEQSLGMDEEEEEVKSSPSEEVAAEGVVSSPLPAPPVEVVDHDEPTRTQEKEEERVEEEEEKVPVNTTLPASTEPLSSSPPPPVKASSEEKEEKEATKGAAEQTKATAKKEEEASMKPTSTLELPPVGPPSTTGKKIQPGSASRRVRTGGFHSSDGRATIQRSMALANAAYGTTNEEDSATLPAGVRAGSSYGSQHGTRLPRAGVLSSTTFNAAYATPGEEYRHFRQQHRIRPSFHGPIYVPEDVMTYCSACGGPVDPVRRVPAGRLFFHMHCIRCFLCGLRSLTDPYFQVGYQAVCSRCAEKGDAKCVPKEEAKKRKVVLGAVRGNAYEVFRAMDVAQRQAQSSSTLNYSTLPDVYPPSLHVGMLHTRRNTTRRTFELVQRQQHYTQNDCNVLFPLPPASTSGTSSPLPSTTISEEAIVPTITAGSSHRPHPPTGEAVKGRVASPARPNSAKAEKL